MINIPILLTLYVGFAHAFETDHLLAVSNMVSNRNRFLKAIKDGMYWGLGHTTTILVVGVIFLLLKFQISQAYFKLFEAGVGLMLIVLGVYRVWLWNKMQRPMLHTHLHTHTDGIEHKHTHLHTIVNQNHHHSHLPAYLIGLVHGLAGSGALILIVMSESATTYNGLCYLLLFGLGSVGGMMVAAAAFSLPFMPKILSNKNFQTFLIFVSAILCVGYGIYVVKENFFG
jgi:high-affinity nickel permease